MPRKVYKFREVWKLLRAHDRRFEQYVARGKGSHRIIYHPSINGRAASYPIPCHSEGDDVKDCYLKALIRRFELPPDFF